MVYNTSVNSSSHRYTNSTMMVASYKLSQDPRVQHPASYCLPSTPTTDHQQHLGYQHHHQRVYQNSRKRKLSFSSGCYVSRDNRELAAINRSDFSSPSSSPQSIRRLSSSPTSTISALEDSTSVYPDSPESVALDSTGDSEYSEDESVCDDHDQERECSAFPLICPPAAKVPKYVGTIYEERLAPLSPVITLPVPSANNGSYTHPLKQGSKTSGDNTFQIKLLDLIKEGNADKLDEFLEENGKLVDINYYSEEGVTPIQQVCQDGGSLAVAKVLVKYGADLRLTSRDGWTALHMATFSASFSLMTFIRNCPK